MAMICLLTATLGGTQVAFVNEIAGVAGIVLAAEDDGEAVAGEPLVVWHTIRRPIFSGARI